MSKKYAACALYTKESDGGILETLKLLNIINATSKDEAKGQAFGWFNSDVPRGFTILGNVLAMEVRSNSTQEGV